MILYVDNQRFSFPIDTVEMKIMDLRPGLILSHSPWGGTKWLVQHAILGYSNILSSKINNFKRDILPFKFPERRTTNLASSFCFEYT